METPEETNHPDTENASIPSEETNTSLIHKDEISLEDNEVSNVNSNSRKHFKYRSTSCLNCEQPLDLSDRYCPYCSQLNSTKQLSVKDFFGEFVNSIVSYDSRLRHTLKDLLFKPGTITRNYVNGKRLRYANPFRFFLSVSIIYFLISSFLMSLEGDSYFKEDNNPVEDNSELDMSFTGKGIKVNFNQPGNDTLIDTDDTQINDVSLSESTPDYANEKYLDSLNFVNGVTEKIMTYRAFYNDTEIKNPDAALDSLRHSKSKFNKWLYNKNSSYDEISDNPSEFITYLVKKIPFFLFFFTPIYALFFLLLYFKSKVTYMEHMVFIFHIFSFVFLTLLILEIPDYLLGDFGFLSSVVLTFIGPFYFYKALRNFYKQSRLLTIFKFCLLNVIFWIGAGITAIVFFLFSAALY